MDYDDFEEDDLPAGRRPRGVSAGWRVAAIVGFVLVAVFGLGLLMAVVQLANQPGAPPPWAAVAPPQPQPPPLAGDADPEGPEDPEPAVPPYPLVQDLRPAGELPPVPGEPAPRREPEAHEQFVRAGAVLWTSDEPFGPERVLVSPDGTHMAYASARGVMVGPSRNLRLVEGTQPREGAAPPGPPVAPGVRPVVCSWSGDGTALAWTGADGAVGVIRVDHFDRLAVAPVAGASARYAVPVPSGQDQWILVRHRSRPKIETGSRQFPADPSEVVVFTPAKRTTRILIPAGTAVWRAPAVSPDGRRLAILSDSGHETTNPRLWRVFVVDVAGGEPKPLSPAAPHVVSVCWAPDGKTLLYDRAAPLTGDDAQPGEGYRTNLFELDPATGRETPLTHGGGFASPSLGDGGALFCLVQRQADGQPRTDLLRIPLTRARELTAAWLAGRRSTRAWLELTALALQDAGLPADAKVGALDEEKMKKLAAAFGTIYRERFRGEPPDTAAELDRLRAEVGARNLSTADRHRVALVLGAVEGEYLRKKHGARWVLAVKPAGPPLADPAAHDLFRHIVNPFLPPWPQERDDDDAPDEPGYGSLAWTLRQAEGRPLVLAHDPAVRSHAPAADPDLARGTALLREGRGDEADRVLLDMTGRNAGNYHLAVQVGALLSDHGRRDALRTLAQRLNPDALKDARVYNLVGVSLLDKDPAAAVVAFRNALRCNLYLGPAYFNLAQAYEKTNNLSAARLCLRRYLKLMGFGPLADDARRRLGELPTDPR